MVRAFIALFSLAALGTVSLAAQDEAPPRPKAGFSAAERETIRSYFATHRHDARPLPPGIAKNLERGKRLPPGIAKRQLPPALVEELPPREGEAKVEITIFGDRIVLLEASGIVIDILEDVFR